MFKKMLYCLAVVAITFCYLFSVVSCNDASEALGFDSQLQPLPPTDEETPTEENETTPPDSTDVPTVDWEYEDENAETEDNGDNEDSEENLGLDRVQTPEWIRGVWYNESSGQGMEDMTFTQYTLTYYGRDYTDGVNNTIFVFANDLLFEIDYTEDGIIKYIIFQKESDNRMTVITDNLDYSKNITYVKAVVED